MRSIKRLPEAVHSSVRSGIILFDFTRVVEELIFNSLDAGASKVSVAVAVGTCYIKVADDGCGITRDGLSLLGERYATSKVDQSADIGIASGSFGFRGEALGSISNISLLEVVTKAQGRPNGYRKVIKACQCLYLGIDDGRQDVGTTVIVRDLFYNQPVRRKHMQSSPRKALHSVKKCVLRIAFMHPKVSFKVVDIESEDELLHTSASPSLLSLLTSSFGFEVSNSLHLLNASDGVLKIYGYISGPSGTFSVKALHYVYINSRYICKGPIHKLLNELASRFNCTVLWKANIGSQNRKQSKSQPYASYILNLVCPRSCYDLTFEPSKTSVEFKDWVPILTFFEKAITQFWSENKSHGRSLYNGTSMSENDITWKEGDNIVSVEEANDEIAKKRRRIQNNEACSGDVSPLLGMLIEESDHRCDRKKSRLSFYKSHGNVLEFKEKQNGYSYLKSHRNASELEKHQTGVPVSQNESPSPSCSESLVQYGMTFNQECNRHLWTSDDNIIFSEDNFFRNKPFNTEKSNEHADNILSSTLGDAYRYIGADMNDELKWSELSCEGFKIDYDVDEFSNDLKKPLLRSCSSQRRMPTDGASFSSHEGFEFQSDGFRIEQKWLDSDHGVDVGEVDDDDHDIEFLPTASALSSPKLIAKSNMHRDLSFLLRNSKKFLAVGEGFAEENDFTPNPVKQTVGPSNLSLDFEQSPATSDPLFGTKPWDVEPFIDYNALERCNNNDNISIYDYGADRKGNDCIFGSDMQNSSVRRSCFSSSFTNIKSEIDSEDDISRSPEGHDLPDVFSPKFSDSFTFEAEWLSSVSRGNNSTNNCAPTSHLIGPSIYLDKYENQRDQFIHKDKKYVCKRRPRRSHSAPPVYKGRKKFFALNNHWALESGKKNAPIIHEAPVLEEASDLKHPQQSSVVFHQHSKLSSVRASSFYGRPDMKEMPDIFGIQKYGVQNKTQGLHIYNVDSVEDFTSKEIHDSLDSQLKWGKGCAQTANGGRQLNLNNQDSILNISSGFLHLSGDSLVPESISKHCLEDAKVLQQVDRKFIPVVASGVLAIIDQHAADERIRLEELRQKVLSGEMKTITYLDTEKELLALPEIGYQLLHNYAEQIQYWGWICNIHAHGSKSFKKNLKLLHRQPSNVTLLAVPCILGVNLTDTDLLEFLQQLADTDGSSTLPPSVLRILNFKACRGAIMFGDALLPSECSLIVEELKQTALCFQCAHGRPTTAPLVNLGALHKQISKLQLWKDGSNESWHGLRRGKVSVARAAQRLSAGGVNVE